VPLPRVLLGKDTTQGCVDRDAFSLQVLITTASSSSCVNMSSLDVWLVLLASPPPSLNDADTAGAAASCASHRSAGEVSGRQAVCAHLCTCLQLPRGLPASGMGRQEHVRRVSGGWRQATQSSPMTWHVHSDVVWLSSFSGDASTCSAVVLLLSSRSPD
jgi:hypothetical protein